MTFLVIKTKYSIFGLDFATTSHVVKQLLKMEGLSDVGAR